MRYSLITWRNGVTEEALASGRWDAMFAAVVLVEAGDIRDAVEELERGDLVFLQTSWNVRLLALLAAEYCGERGRPLISAIHTSSHSTPEAASRPLQRGWLARTIAASSRIVCVSEAVAESLAELVEVAGAAVTVIPNASRFRATGETRGIGPRRIVSYIGRPTPAKGIADFVALAKMLSDTDLRFRCNTVDSDTGDQLQPLPSNFELCYGLSDSEMEAFFAETNVVVATYRHSEGLPLAVVEALSLGIPAIGYDSPGLGQLLRDHGQFMTEIGDIEALAAVLRAWDSGRFEFPLPAGPPSRGWRAAVDQYLAVFAEVAETA